MGGFLGGLAFAGIGVLVGAFFDAGLEEIERRFEAPKFSILKSLWKARFKIGKGEKQTTSEQTAETLEDEGKSAIEDPTFNFVRMLVVLFVAVANADQTTSSREIQYVRRYFTSRFPFKEAMEWSKIFEQMVFQYLDYRAICRQIKEEMTYPMRLQLLQMLYELAGTDAEIDAKEDAIIAEIAINMGIGANEQSSVRALYFEEEDGPYKVLGLKRSASEDEIKHAFHLLVNQYHPDKVAHLGAEFMKIANEKFVAIKEAYDEIKKEKGL